jgi:hypothetical protein
MADKNPFGEYDLTITIPLQNWGEIKDLAEYTKMLELALVEGESDHRMDFHAQMITHGLLNRLAKALRMQIEQAAQEEFGTNLKPRFDKSGKKNGDISRWVVEAEKRQKKTNPPWLRGEPTVEITKYEGPLR